MATSLLSESQQQAANISHALYEAVTPQKVGETKHDYLRRSYNHERAYWNKNAALAVPHITNSTCHGRPIRVYEPDITATTTLIYLHGGGWVVGNLDTHDAICRFHAVTGHMRVIALDYSLSPEAAHPTALDEAFNLLQYCQQQYGDDIVVAGDSAGAHMAMALSLYCRDNGHNMPASLLLYYGYYGLQDSASFRLYGHDETYGLTRDDMHYYRDSYLGSHTTNNPNHPPYFDVLHYAMAGMPPAIIIAAGLDPLRDDSRALHAMYKQANIACQYAEFDYVLHGFIQYSSIMPEAKRAMRMGVEFAHTIPAVRAGRSLLELAADYKARIRNIQPSELAAMRHDAGVKIIDIRDIRELWREGKISGAYHAPRGMIEAWIDPESPYFKDIFSDAPTTHYILYCAAGVRSAFSANDLHNLGIKVSHLEGGFSAWQAWVSTQHPTNDSNFIDIVEKK